jgi:asparagine synthase (glutamine-hydrolysing)
MCGIFGVVSSNKLPENRVKMSEIIINSMGRRGPDGSGIWFNDTSRVNFVHTRLSILDLTSAGQQPMSTNDKRYTITYNGEIYNFIEVKKELVRAGFRFNSDSDTEVILYAFSYWGQECVKKFEGMFSIAIWDNLEETLWLFRDRVGVKPLYYYESNNIFIFSSELKSIRLYLSNKPKLNYNSIGEFLQHGYISGCNSIYDSIFKLEPAHCLMYNKKGVKKINRYWSSLDYYDMGIYKKSENELIEELEHLLFTSFKKRLVSDVPVGVFLSGGVDSSLVAALLQSDSTLPIDTFTIGFKGYPHDESVWAKKVADHLGTNHTTVNLSLEDARNSIRLIPEAYDEPFADNSSLPTLLLSKITAQKVKVALSGDGADELFGGYKHYQLTANKFNKFCNPSYNRKIIQKSIKYFGVSRLEKIAKMIGRPKTSDFNHFIQSEFQSNTLNEIYETYVSFWYKSEAEELLGMKLNKNPKLNNYKGVDLQKMMFHEFHEFLPNDILVKIDRASMFYGLEAREPFLDQNIIEFAARLPIEMKIKGDNSKYILKKILNKHIPNNLINRPKQGFVMPVSDWLGTSWSHLIYEYLSYDVIKEDGIFDPKIVSNTVNLFRSGKTGYTYKIWNLLLFQLWKEKWY